MFLCYRIKKAIALLKTQKFSKIPSKISKDISSNILTFFSILFYLQTVFLVINNFNVLH